MKTAITALSTAILIIVCSSLNGQNWSVRAGNKAYEKFDFKTAVLHFQDALKKTDDSASLNLKIADCYRFLNDMEMAEKWYARVIDQKIDNFEPILHYAQALRTNKKYDAARKAYHQYLQHVPEDEATQKIYDHMDLLIELQETDGQTKLKYQHFNSEESEFSPAYLNDRIIFVSDRSTSGLISRKDSWTNKSFMQLYSVKDDARSESGHVSKLPISPINGIYHEGPVSYDKQSGTMYITRSNYTSRTAYKSEEETVNLKLFKLSYSESNGDWGNLEEAIPFNSDEYSVCHPSVSKDGSMLFFSSDMPGSTGKTDLYVCYKNGKDWSEPQSLGPKINTKGREVFPTIADDGYLYFASEGHIGLGGLDLYRTNYIAGQWSVPENLGAPFNSNKDDFGLIINSENNAGYFSSNRKGNYFDDDIYSFTTSSLDQPQLEKELAKLQDLVAEEPLQPVHPELHEKLLAMYHSDYEDEVLDALNNDIGETDHKSLKALADQSSRTKLKVEIVDKITNDPIEEAEVVVTEKRSLKQLIEVTDARGVAYFENLDANLDYDIQAYKSYENSNDKYLIVREEIYSSMLIPGATIMKTVELQKFTLGKAFRIENIYYDYNKWYLRYDAQYELDKLVKLLSDNPTIEIELSSHTDSRGSDNYNKMLSEKRAEEVVKFVAGKGIEQARMDAAGYGETQPVNKCTNGVKCREALHQDNRRTEIRILRF